MLGEWTEDRPRAFHLRRRLSWDEEMRVGPALDCRNGDEGAKRLKAIAAFLPMPAIAMAQEEIGFAQSGEPKAQGQ